MLVSEPLIETGMLICEPATAPDVYWLSPPPPPPTRPPAPDGSRLRERFRFYVSLTSGRESSANHWGQSRSMFADVL